MITCRKLRAQQVFGCNLREVLHRAHAVLLWKLNVLWTYYGNVNFNLQWSMIFYPGTFVGPLTDPVSHWMKQTPSIRHWQDSVNVKLCVHPFLVNHGQFNTYVFGGWRVHASPPRWAFFLFPRSCGRCWLGVTARSTFLLPIRSSICLPSGSHIFIFGVRAVQGLAVSGLTYFPLQNPLLGHNLTFGCVLRAGLSAYVHNLSSV